MSATGDDSEAQYNVITTAGTSLYGHHGNRTCAELAPRSADLLSNLGTAQVLLVLTMAGCMIATLVIYIEEVIFCVKAFRISERRKKTIWILAFFPVFSVCSFIGIIVPKSGPLVHMCANLFFCTCLYQLMRLTVSYMGGAKNIWKLIEKDRHMQMNTLPLCCCCLCCPRPLFNRQTFIKTTLLVLQIAIVRPLCLFISAVLWIDSIRVARHQQVFATGELSPRRSFVWLALINVISTCLAVWGLVMTSKVLAPELEKDFVIRGKIVSIQGTLIMTVIPNIIIGGLVGGGVIKCTELLPAKVRGEEIYFCILVTMMLPFSLLGRKNFRRISDGNTYAKGCHGDELKQPVNGQGFDHLTSKPPMIEPEVAGGLKEEFSKDPNRNIIENCNKLNNTDKRISMKIDLSDSKAVEYLMKDDDCVEV